ncbi:hypothetical protein WS96_10785 [Burkholderia sp. MSMB1835]|nr:hypothetical protein WS96_10785 [Burkholderia sp. MSMB1835]
MKTGAVSQYGADAIGGIVNIIAKRNFCELQLDGSIGSAINAGNGDGTTKFGVPGTLSQSGYDTRCIRTSAASRKSARRTSSDGDTRKTDQLGRAAPRPLPQLGAAFF